MLRLFCFALGVLATGCTSVGFHDLAKRNKMDFGPSVTMRICLLQDRDVSQAQADSIKAALRKELRPYGIEVIYPWVQPWDQPGFWSSTQLQGLLNAPLVPPCDRVFGLADRHVGDFLWSIFLPSVMGEVETLTHTRGFAASGWGTHDLLGFYSPESIAVHEGYHLLGCGHALSMDDCYEQIRMVKVIAIQDRERGNDFFPAVSKDGHVLRTREEVDTVLYQYVLSIYDSPEMKKNQR